MKILRVLFKLFFYIQDYDDGVKVSVIFDSFGTNY